jgi:glycosyltransferase involved in cell wall biosynthesis
LREVAKILYLNPSSEVGGAERSLLDLLKHLDKKQYYPIVSFPSEGKLTWELERIEIERKVIGFHPEISKLSRENGNRSFHQFLSIPLYLLPTIIKMGRFVRSRDIDVIVTNGIKCHFIGSMVSLMTRTRLIWHVRDLVEKGWLKWMLRTWGRFFPDKIITNSHAVSGIFSGNRRKEVVYNGIDLSHFRSGINGRRIRSQFKMGKDTMLIGTIGHFAPLKGYEELLEAIGEVVKAGYDVKLAIVGDAVYQNSNRYKQKILRILKDKIILTGFREDISELLASFDLSVLPSRSEGFGRVNLEAMAMGKPVISTKIGGIPEVVLDGVTGILVPPRDSKALSHAVMMLLSDSHLRESMGQEGRRRVEEHFTLQAHVQRIERIYAEGSQGGIDLSLALQALSPILQKISPFQHNCP